jgi:hypothetical protein
MSRVIGLLIRLDALETRLDAARRKAKAAPGQLDLFGGAGSGGGEPCGQSWIDPNKTCRKTGGPPKSMDVRQPFSAETMERIVSGIESRAFHPPAARHTGTDLALGLQKLAEAPGLAGENARKAMAFMDEVKAIVMIQPQRQYGPHVQLNAPLPVWNNDKSVEENVEGLNRYLLERENGAQLVRNFARRTGLWPEELIQALEADKSPGGRDMGIMLRRGRDGQVQKDGKPTADAALYQDRRERLNKAVKAYKEFTENDPYNIVGQRDLIDDVVEYFNETRNYSFMGGPDADFGNAYGAMKKTLAMESTGGHYTATGNVYWKVSMAGQSKSRLDPDEVRQQGMQAVVANTLNVRDKRIAFAFSYEQGLSESEGTLVTHLHELGHMVHDASQRRVTTSPAFSGKQIIFNAKATKAAPTEMHDLIAAGRAAGPTSYSNTNVAELFAESFAAYVVAPEALRQYNADLYGWVDSSVAKARKNAVDSVEAKVFSTDY